MLILGSGEKYLGATYVALYNSNIGNGEAKPSQPLRWSVELNGDVVEVCCRGLRLKAVR